MQSHKCVHSPDGDSWKDSLVTTVVWVTLVPQQLTYVGIVICFASRVAAPHVAAPLVV